MKKVILLISAITFTFFLNAQQYDSTIRSVDENAVKLVVEKFLEAAGNYNFEAMITLFASNANIGGASFRDGKWKTNTMTLEEFIAALKSESNPKKYKEPVSKFTIHIDMGKLAFVKADANLFWEGKAQRTNYDYFTLINVNGEWKILNGSYVSVPIEK